MSIIATELLTQAEQRYRARTPGSERAFREASEYLAGGISANVKFFSPYPPFMSGDRADPGPRFARHFG